MAATAKVEQMYHSVALLLPGGKIMAANGNPNKGNKPDWSEDPNEELRVEIYSPPYLFQGTRLAIGTVKEEWKYGETMNIPFTHIGSILWASLIRNGAVTYSSNTGQRFVVLEIVSQSGGVLSVAVTNNPNLAPPSGICFF